MLTGSLPPLKPAISIQNDPTPYVFTESWTYQTTKSYNNLIYACGNNRPRKSITPRVTLHLNLFDDRTNGYHATNFALTNVHNLLATLSEYNTLDAYATDGDVSSYPILSLMQETLLAPQYFELNVVTNEARLMQIISAL